MILLKNGSLNQVTLVARNIFLETADGSLNQITIKYFPSATGCVCRNFIQKALIYFRYDNNNNLVGAVADYVLKAEENFGCSNSQESISIPLEMQVIFENSNNQSLPRTGGLGYDIGTPLMVGKEVTLSQANATNKKAVSIWKPNFYIGRSDSNGNCYTATSESQFKVFDKETILKFRYNSFISCRKTLTLNELRDYCQSKAIINENLLYSFFSRAQYIGKFANANPGNLQDWIRVAFRDANMSPSNLVTSYDSIAGKCTMNFPYLVIYYSAFGSAVNFQFKINHAEFQVKELVWTYKQSSYLNIKQDFLASFQVLYVEIPNPSTFYKAPAPALSPYLNNNVMYPFQSAFAQTLKGLVLASFLILTIF